VPPPLKIRSPQRIVSLQHLHHKIELKSLSIDASRCSAIDTITRDSYKVYFKYIEGIQSSAQGERWRVLSDFSNPAKPLVQCEIQCPRNSERRPKGRWTVIIFGANPVQALSRNIAEMRSAALAYQCSGEL
jgi:hypothetical protein